MQIAVHVGVGERGQVLGGVLLFEAHFFVALEDIHLVKLFIGASLSDAILNLFQVLQTGLLFCLFDHFTAKISMQGVVLFARLLENKVASCV